MPLGIYISVPFCRTKCSFCNFASGVVSKAVFARYLDRVAADLRGAESFARGIGEYGSVIFIAGNMPMRTETIPLLIMIHLDQFETGTATAIALTYLVAALLLLIAVQSMQSRRR